MPIFDINPTATAPSQGLLMGLDPNYQLEQQRLVLAKQQVAQAQAFQGGLPTTDLTTDGPIDYNAAARRMYQLGDFSDASNLLSTGYRMSVLNSPASIDNPTGRPLPVNADGGASPSPASSSAPQAAVGQPPGLLPKFFAAQEQANKLPAGYLTGTARIESGFDPNAHNDGSGAQGPFGFTPGTAKQYGLTDARDWTQSTIAAAKLGADNANVLRAALGREPTAGELYLAHQQGAAGALKLLQNPNVPAGQLVGASAISSNGGDPRAPASIFAQRWTSQFDDASAQPSATPGKGAAPYKVASLGPAAAPSGSTGTPDSAGSPPSSGFMTTTEWASKLRPNDPTLGKRLADAIGVDPGESIDPGDPTIQKMASPVLRAPIPGAAAEMGVGSDVPSGAAPASTDIPPGVADAISRLRVGQGTDGDKTLWAAWARARTRVSGGADDDTPVGDQHPYGPKSVSSGGTAAVAVPVAAGGFSPVTPGGAESAQRPVGAPLAPPAGVPSRAPVASGAPPAGEGGPDLPNLPAGYQQPGGATRYITDLMDQAGTLEAIGSPKAKTFQARAAQVQNQLIAAQKLQNDLVLEQRRSQDRYGAQADNALIPSVQPDGSTIMIPKTQALASARDGTPIMSAQPAYATTGQQNLLTKLDAGSRAYQERQVASQRLDALAGLLESFQTGANSEMFNNAVANARSFGIDVPNSVMADPGKLQQFVKDSYANVLSTMSEQGNKAFVSEVQSAINSNPNPNLQPEANAAMIAQMQGIKRWTDQNFRDYAKWYHGNKGAADDADFQTSWVDQHPLGAFVDAAGKDIAPAGLPLPSQDKLVDGQAYQVGGKKVRWSAASGSFVPFTGPSSPSLPGGSGSGSPPIAGARQAKDGRWYVPDPNRPGKFLMAQ